MRFGLQGQERKVSVKQSLQRTTLCYSGQRQATLFEDHLELIYTRSGSTRERFQLAYCTIFSREHPRVERGNLQRWFDACLKVHKSKT